MASTSIRNVRSHTRCGGRSHRSLAEVGVPPRRALYLLGHTDPTSQGRGQQNRRDIV
jgi:hypothetical protein